MSILRDIDAVNCSLRKLKKLRKVLRKRPASFFTFPKSDYAKVEMQFLDKLIADKQKAFHDKAKVEEASRLIKFLKKVVA